MKGFHIITGLLWCIALQNIAFADNIYKVKNIKQGESLKLKQFPSRDSKTLVALPHDASWILRRDKGRKVVDKVVWRKVQWNNSLGWLSAYYIENDPAAEEQAVKRQACLNDRNIKEKICCGYTKAARKQAFKHVPILMVKNVPVGKSLFLYSQPTEFGKKLVAIPHNATWIADLGKNKRHQNGTMWSHVRWTGKIGWVKSAFVKPDSQTTHIGDLKRKLCTGVL
ncbi:MAG TPA: hypothetical protein EYH38_06540 [Leucothrix sp.]|nr:hypothetical protein [Leucothrix sp.]